MTTKHREKKLITLLKGCLYAATLVMAINVSEARVYVGIGVGGGYPGGYGYPNYCVPGHWAYGYWYPGNCGYGDQYYYSPGPTIIFGGVGGGFDHHHDHHHH